MGEVGKNCRIGLYDLGSRKCRRCLRPTAISRVRKTIRWVQTPQVTAVQTVSIRGQFAAVTGLRRLSVPVSSSEDSPKPLESSLYQQQPTIDNPARVIRCDARRRFPLLLWRWRPFPSFAMAQGSTRKGRLTDAGPRCDAPSSKICGNRQMSAIRP